MSATLKSHSTSHASIPSVVRALAAVIRMVAAQQPGGAHAEESDVWPWGLSRFARDVGRMSKRNTARSTFCQDRNTREWGRLAASTCRSDGQRCATEALHDRHARTSGELR